MPTIINVRGREPNDPSVLYCGRKTRNGWNASPVGNPYHRSFQTVETTLLMYRQWLVGEIDKRNRAVIQFMQSITEHSQLGCWCAPARCHVEVIVSVWKERFASGNHHG